jgi:hypothetical protein
VSPAAEQINRHIAVLEEFEQAYGEFLVERRSPDHGWSGEERARRERALKELAPQAEAAMVAAGAKRWDEGPVRINLPARILRFVDEGDGVDDTEQWQILEEIPTHIGALKGKLPEVPDMGLKDFDTEAPPTSVRVEPAPTKAPWWREHLAVLIVTVIGTVAGGAILIAIFGNGG